MCGSVVLVRTEVEHLVEERDASGAEVVSSSQVSLPLPEHVPVGSLVTVARAPSGARVAGPVSGDQPTLDAYLLLSLE